LEVALRDEARLRQIAARRPGLARGGAVTLTEIARGSLFERQYAR